MQISLRSTAWYEARVAFGLTALLPALLLPGYALLGLIIWTSRGVPQIGEINYVVQLALPLVAGLIGSHLLSIEREVGFDPLRRSYAEPFWRLPLWRIGGAVLLTLASALVTTIILEIATRGEFAPDQAIVPMLAPSLYLLGLAMLINNVSGNYWVAGMAVVGYWFIEYQSKGAYTGSLFLFRAAMPGTADYDLNQALLFIIGMLWLYVTVFYSGFRRKRGW